MDRGRRAVGRNAKWHAKSQNDLQPVERLAVDEAIALVDQIEQTADDHCDKEGATCDRPLERLSYRLCYRSLAHRYVPILATNAPVGAPTMGCDYATGRKHISSDEPHVRTGCHEIVLAGTGRPAKRYLVRRPVKLVP